MSQAGWTFQDICRQNKHKDMVDGNTLTFFSYFFFFSKLEASRQGQGLDAAVHGLHGTSPRADVFNALSCALALVVTQ